jgi:hypothetical protein
MFTKWANTQTLNDPIHINYIFIPQTNFKNVSGNISTDFFEFNTTTPPFKLNNNIKVYNSLYFRNSNHNYVSELSQLKSLPTALKDIRYTAIIRTQLNTNLEIVAMPRIMIRSDLKQSINGSDLFPQVAVFANYAVNGNPNFKIGLGGALNNDFERNSLVLLGTLYYNSKKVKIEIVYPNANFLYKKSENFEFGIFANVDGAISRVGQFQLEDEVVNYFRTFQLLIAPTVTHRIYKQIFGHLKIGFIPIRRFETMNSDFKAIQNQNFDLKSSVFFRTSISFRLKN